ncbi:cofilin [Coemansia sp. Benny D160-2]|nr:cofilin [Coemansia sp. Benny D160-2]
MSSGITVTPECIEAFGKLKDEHKLQFVIYKLSDNLKNIVVDSTSDDPILDESGNPIKEPEDDYERFLSRLPENDGRYAVYEVKYMHEGGKREKVVFYSWVPEKTSIKHKMLYASSRSEVEQKLQGFVHVVQATESDDVLYSTIEKTLSNKFF